MNSEPGVRTPSDTDTTPGDRQPPFPQSPNGNQSTLNRPFSPLLLTGIFCIPPSNPEGRVSAVLPDCPIVPTEIVKPPDIIVSHDDPVTAGNDPDGEYSRSVEDSLSALSARKISLLSVEFFICVYL